MMDYWQLIGVCAFSFLALIMTQVAGIGGMCATGAILWRRK